MHMNEYTGTDYGINIARLGMQRLLRNLCPLNAEPM